jgi:hypothetical protein
MRERPICGVVFPEQLLIPIPNAYDDWYATCSSGEVNDIGGPNAGCSSEEVNDIGGPDAGRTGNACTQNRREVAMYEVVVTFRPDFSERVVDRYATEEEAQAAAERISAQQAERVIRAWVRYVREAKARE